MTETNYLLPKGWRNSTLIELAKFIDYRGRTPKKTEHGIPLITAKNIKRGYIDRNPREFIAIDAYDEWMTRGIPKVGDVLLTTEAPLGNVAIIDINEKFALAQRAICFQFYDGYVASFISYFLRSPQFQQVLNGSSTGTTVKGIKAATLKKLAINIPPLPEQKRIVAKLDELLAQVDSIQQRLNNLPKIIKRFRQSVLAAAVSGKLTEQWRGDNNKELSSWKVEELGNITSDVSYGYTASSSPENVGPKMIRITDIQGGNVEWDKVPYCEISENKIGKYLVAENDLLFARTGATVGKSFLVKEAPPHSVYASYLIRVRCKDSSSINYLYKYFNSPHYWSQITEFSSGIGQPSVNGTKLKKLSIPLPPIEEQSEIVHLVDQYFALADSLEKHLANVKKRVDNLTQSILAKAFRGELVPQDPNDEPADQLLARIKAARIDAEKLEKAAKKAARTSKAKKK